MKKKKSIKRNYLKQMEGTKIPNVIFKSRIRDNNLKKNPYRWKTLKGKNLFNKKCVIFSIPGAFTPTCSSKHVPDFEKKYNSLKKLGIDEVYCVSVNDAFVMNSWKKKLRIKNIKMLPDGNGIFTKKMGALVKKNNLGFGERSWRYSMLVNNGKIKKLFIEPHMKHNYHRDPFSVSSVQNMIKYLQVL